jgi:S-DNA-T family DNA segregation ATPase FtsK/SpoIIIE
MTNFLLVTILIINVVSLLFIIRLANSKKERDPEELGDDELYELAVDIVMKTKKASASLLQRRLRIGYGRAARLLDILEERGVVGSADGARPREVLKKQ